jgi:hypothetical protein
MTEAGCHGAIGVTWNGILGEIALWITDRPGLAGGGTGLSPHPTGRSHVPLHAWQCDQTGKAGSPGQHPQNELLLGALAALACGLRLGTA